MLGKERKGKIREWRAQKEWDGQLTGWWKGVMIDGNTLGRPCRHMLLVICSIIRNQSHWHVSTLSLSLPYSLHPSTLTFPQAKVYSTREDDGKQRPLSSPVHVTFLPPSSVSLLFLWLEIYVSYPGNRWKSEPWVSSTGHPADDDDEEVGDVNVSDLHLCKVAL